MRVMVIVKASNDSEAGKMPGKELLESMGKFNQELINAGVMVEAAGLRNTANGARVQFSGTARAVSMGPFPISRDLIAGYWIWKVDSLQAAIDWVQRCPNPHEQDCEIEIRTLFEDSDFLE